MNPYTFDKRENNVIKLVSVNKTFSEVNFDEMNHLQMNIWPQIL